MLKHKTQDLKTRREKELEHRGMARIGIGKQKRLINSSRDYCVNYAFLLAKTSLFYLLNLICLSEVDRPTCRQTGLNSL